MLGLIRRQQWHWFLAGKHPAAGDFLQLGRATPLLRGFSGWMEKGYEGLAVKSKCPSALAWNFWALGPNGELVCGRMRMSRDNHGRCYPLMIVGAGPVAGRSEHWDLLPYACQETWTAIGALGAPGITRIRELKRKVAGVRFAEPCWETLYRKREMDKETVICGEGQKRASGFMDKMNNIEGLSRLDHFLVPLDVGAGALMPTSKLLRLLKSRSALEPAMVFTGGSEAAPYLFCLKRPLVLQDFGVLWAAGREGA